MVFIELRNSSRLRKPFPSTNFYLIQNSILLSSPMTNRKKTMCHFVVCRRKFGRCSKQKSMRVLNVGAVSEYYPGVVI